MGEFPSIDPRIQSKFARAMFKAVEQERDAREALYDSGLIPQLLEEERNARQAIYESGVLVKAVDQLTIGPAAAKSLVETTNQLEQSLIQVAVDLDVPSLQADLYTISRARNRPPAIDVDQVRPPAERIHDNLIWEDGKWYREKTWELAVDLADYIVWNIKDKGQMGNATSREMAFLTMGLIAVIGLVLSMGLTTVLLTGAVGGIVYGTMEAADERTERKDLDERFG